LRGHPNIKNLQIGIQDTNLGALLHVPGDAYSLRIANEEREEITMMKSLIRISLGTLLATAGLYAQQTQPQGDQSGNPQDQQPVYEQRQNQGSDQDRIPPRDRDQYNDRDRDRVNEYNQYDNQDENKTYSGQERQNRGQYRYNNEQNQNNEDWNENREDRDRLNGYNNLPQSDRDTANMNDAERQGFQDGISAGRSDRESGRNFSPERFVPNAVPQDRQLYRQGFREGYSHGYYGRREPQNKSKL